jgi:hypothetical protein
MPAGVLAGRPPAPHAAPMSCEDACAAAGLSLVVPAFTVGSLVEAPLLATGQFPSAEAGDGDGPCDMAEGDTTASSSPFASCSEVSPLAAR